MSSILLFVVALVATTCAANVPDFSEEALQALGLTEPDVEKNDAQLINSKVKIELGTDNLTQTDGVTLFAISKPGQGQNQESCGDKIGVKVEDGPSGCDVLYLRLITGEKNDVNFARLITFFGSGGDKPIFIITPIFKIPSAQATADEQQIWANSNKVGITSPIDSQTLKSVKESAPVTLDLEWLNNLLSYGLATRESSKYLVSFVTRPLVLPESIVDELVEVVESMKEKQESDDMFFFRVCLQNMFLQKRNTTSAGSKVFFK